jgi:ribosomal protein S18 acetylase RimI-like enzyme
LEKVPVCPEDESFLFQVYASTRMEEVAAWGWTASQQEQFLFMQFTMQQQSYASRFPSADHLIIVDHMERLGRIIVERQEEEILLIDISLLPPYRNKGIGTTLIKELQEEAHLQGKLLRLHVLKTNIARRLYERLGFSVTEEDDMYCRMVWK